MENHPLDSNNSGPVLKFISELFEVKKSYLSAFVRSPDGWGEVMLESIS
jgi:hypothetical protein